MEKVSWPFIWSVYSTLLAGGCALSNLVERHEVSAATIAYSRVLDGENDTTNAGLEIGLTYTGESPKAEDPLVQRFEDLKALNPYVELLRSTQC